MLTWIACCDAAFITHFNVHVCLGNSPFKSDCRDCRQQNSIFIVPLAINNSNSVTINTLRTNNFYTPSFILKPRGNLTKVRQTFIAAISRLDKQKIKWQRFSFLKDKKSQFGKFVYWINRAPYDAAHPEEIYLFCDWNKCWPKSGRLWAFSFSRSIYLSLSHTRLLTHSLAHLLICTFIQIAGVCIEFMCAHYATIYVWSFEKQSRW